MAKVAYLLSFTVATLLLIFTWVLAVGLFISAVRYDGRAGWESGSIIAILAVELGVVIYTAKRGYRPLLAAVTLLAVLNVGLFVRIV